MATGRGRWMTVFHRSYNQRWATLVLGWVTTSVYSWYFWWLCGSPFGLVFFIYLFLVSGLSSIVYYCSALLMDLQLVSVDQKVFSALLNFKQLDWGCICCERHCVFSSKTLLSSLLRAHFNKNTLASDNFFFLAVTQGIFHLWNITMCIKCHTKIAFMTLCVKTLQQFLLYRTVSSS